MSKFDAVAGAFPSDHTFQLLYAPPEFAPRTARNVEADLGAGAVRRADASIVPKKVRGNPNADDLIQSHRR